MVITKSVSCLNFKLSWKLTEWVTLLGLLIITGFFVNNVWQEYVSNATSVKTYFEEQEDLDLPVIVMCFNPGVNPIVRQKYNTSLHDILGHTNFQSNVSLYEEAIYKIGRDFNITFSGVGVNKEFQKFQGLNTQNIEIEELYTFVSSLCYRIKPNLKIKISEKLSMNLVWRNDLKFKPKVTFYFTSGQNSYNVIDTNVMGNILYVETESTGQYAIMLQKSKYKKVDTASNCISNQNVIIPMECYGKRYSKRIIVRFIIYLIHFSEL